MSKEHEISNEDARMMRYIDGEMDSAERQAFESEMKRHELEGDVIGHMAPGEMALDPDRVRAEQQSVERLSSMLQSGIAAKRDIADAESFNKGILDRIQGKE